MSAEDIDRIEQELGITLPKDYRRVMLSYPFKPEQDTTAEMLFNDADRLIEANRYRETSIRRKGKEVMLVELHHFQIGSDGGEECYYLDLRQDPSPVYCQLEICDMERYAGDIDEFVGICQKFQREADEDQRLMAEREANRPWWRFW